MRLNTCNSAFLLHYIQYIQCGGKKNYTLVQCNVCLTIQKSQICMGVYGSFCHHTVSPSSFCHSDVHLIDLCNQELNRDSCQFATHKGSNRYRVSNSIQYYICMYLPAIVLSSLNYLNNWMLLCNYISDSCKLSIHTDCEFHWTGKCLGTRSADRCTCPTYCRKYSRANARPNGRSIMGRKGNFELCE